MASSKRIRVGIFVIAGTLILVAALYFIGSRQHIFSKNMELYAVFENVSGLQQGNNVRYSGINIGTVSKIEMQEIGKITVEMLVEEKSARFILKNAIASISSDGLVGSMVVNIVPGKEEQSLPVEIGDVIQSTKNIGIDDMLVTLDKTSADLLKISHQILEGKGTIGTLISDTILAQNIQQTILELRNTSEGTGVAMAKINAIISKINYDESAAAVLLSNPATALQIKTVFSNLERSSNDVNAMTKNLDDYIKEIKTGKGALNHLTQDEAFVKELDSTMIQIKEASEKLNQNMEALQHNFLFRRYFKKLEKQKRKQLDQKH